MDENQPALDRLLGYYARENAQGGTMTIVNFVKI